MTRKLLSALAAVTVILGLSACGSPKGESVSQLNGEVFADNLWAGLVSYDIERYHPNACGDYHPLDRDPIRYGGWARQRAGIRNICFQIWKPGVTDTENPNYWQELDVQIHYKRAGEWHQRYVNSDQRLENNRRYVWNMDIGLDPFYIQPMLADIPYEYRILRDGTDTALVEATLEFYFTINGHRLDNSGGEPFRIAYQGYARKVATEPGDGPEVLHPRISCPDFAAGGGAGFNAVDIKSTAATETILSALVADGRFRAPLRLTEGEAKILSVAFSSGYNTGATLTYGNGLSWNNASVVNMDLEDETLRVTFQVNRDGASATIASAEFNGCRQL